MLQNGASPVAIQHILGHADLSHLSQYLRLSIVDLREMHRGSLPGS
jgi:site-specific recombinase XerD